MVLAQNKAKERSSKIIISYTWHISMHLQLKLRKPKKPSMPSPYNFRYEMIVFLPIQSHPLSPDAISITDQTITKEYPKIIEKFRLQGLNHDGLIHKVDKCIALGKNKKLDTFPITSL